MGTFEGEYTAFLGHTRMAGGGLEEVVTAVKRAMDDGPEDRLAVYRDEDARVLDFDFRGSVEEVLGRLTQHPIVGIPQEAPTARRGPGRPKLGVVSREVTLLPRHWEWLGEQRGGASATLRRLVEEARKRDSEGNRDKKVQETAYSFMSDMAADLPGYEEASRALFAGDHGAVEERIAAWPADVRDYLLKIVRR